MTSIKRCLEEEEVVATVEDYCDIVPSPKRLRGGRPFGEDDDMVDEILLDDDFADVDELIPDDADDVAESNVVFSDLTEKVRNRWLRPALPSDFSNDADLNMQWLDIDMTNGRPLPENPNPCKPVLGSLTGTVPVIRVYGVNERGHSITAFIHG